MNRVFACLVLTTALLSACGQSEAPAQSAAPPVGEIVGPVTAASATPAGDAVLIDGYIPPFPHKVRSRRDDDSHFVVVEYLGINRDAAIDMLAESLSNEGFEVRGPIARGEAVQYKFFHTDGRRLDAIFAAPSSFDLAYPDARGVVMFGWTDPVTN